MNYELARANTNKVIDFIERNYGREVTDLERDLLNWLSDDEVLEFAENNLEGFKEDDDEGEDDVDLPTEIYVDLEDLGLGYYATEEMINDAINDYLSETYGWCVKGYCYDALDDGIEITNIDWDTTE